MNVKLVVVGGEAHFSEVELSLPTVIGRGRECDVVIKHRLVSRRHCELCEREGKLFVRDLESLNGTFVGNDRIGEAELPDNSLLTVGHITFRAIYGPVSGGAAKSASKKKRKIEVPSFPPPIGDDDETKALEDDTVYEPKERSPRGLPITESNAVAESLHDSEITEASTPASPPSSDPAT